jgi:hypothetical protein
MLQLRPEQYEALLAHSFKAMESRIAAALRRTWPHLCGAMGDEALHRRVRGARTRARKQGIGREVEILRYAKLALVWGDEFDDSADTPWAAEILAWKNADAPTRLDALEGRSDVELQRRPDLSERMR